MNIVTYINEAVEEMHHVRWPTRQQAVRLSIIVIAFVAVASGSLGFVDFLLGKVLSALLSIA